jgi:hypothetical protein
MRVDDQSFVMPGEVEASLIVRSDFINERFLGRASLRSE